MNNFKLRKFLEVFGLIIIKNREIFVIIIFKIVCFLKVKFKLFILISLI